MSEKEINFVANGIANKENLIREINILEEKINRRKTLHSINTHVLEIIEADEIRLSELKNHFKNKN